MLSRLRLLAAKATAGVRIQSTPRSGSRKLPFSARPDLQAQRSALAERMRIPHCSERCAGFKTAANRLKRMTANLSD